MPPRATGAVTMSDVVRSALLAVRHNLWILLAIVAAFVIAGFAFLATRAPYYEAQASIIIDPRIDQSLEASAQAPAVMLADALVVDSEMEIMRSEPLLRQVIERLGLEQRTRTLLVAEGEPVPEDAVVTDMTLRALLRNLQIERVGSTFVVEIRARAAEPRLAADIANTLAEAYVASQSDVSAERTREVSAWLEGEVENLRAEVRAAESAVTEFIAGHDLPVLEDAESGVQQELTQTEGAIVAARARMREARAEIAAIERLGGGDPATLHQRQHQLILTLGGRDGLPTRDFPSELARLEEARRITIDIAEREVAALTERRDELRGEIARIGRQELELRELQRRADALRDQYESILARAQDSASEGGFHRSNARRIQDATRPLEPANLSASVVLAAFGIGGLAVGFVFVFLREQLDDTIRRSSDLVGHLDVPFLGPLPRIRERDLKALPLQPAEPLAHTDLAELKRLTAADAAPHSVLAETLRRALFQLRRQSDDPRPRLVAVTALLSGEGKSFFASNFAFFLARQGYRVTLVDGDVRKSHLSATFRELTERRANGADGGRLAVPLAPNLDFVPAPRMQHGSLEKHLSAVMDEVDATEPPVHFVILDTPPVAYVADALQVSPLIDSAILVVKAGATSLATLQRFLDMNRPVAEKLIGACMSGSESLRTRPFEFIPAGSSYYYWPGKGAGASGAGASGAEASGAAHGSTEVGLGRMRRYWPPRARAAGEAAAVDSAAVDSAAVDAAGEDSAGGETAPLETLDQDHVARR